MKKEKGEKHINPALLELGKGVPKKLPKPLPIIEQKCFYPDCKKKKDLKNHAITMTDDANKTTTIKLCVYHKHLVSLNQGFTAKNMGYWSYKIQGPIEQISLVEQVIASMELTRAYYENKEKQ